MCIVRVVASLVIFCVNNNLFCKDRGMVNVECVGLKIITTLNAKTGLLLVHHIVEVEMVVIPNPKGEILRADLAMNVGNMFVVLLCVLLRRAI